VWIDITNSPHVLFFAPFIDDLHKGGHEVTVTAREYAQTVPLLEQKRLEYTLIGRHRGASMNAKALGLLSRSTSLMNFARGRHFDVAFSHNSNDMSVAAAFLGIPLLMVHDYEHAKLSYAVNARLASRILVPEAIPKAAIVKHGTTAEKVGHFPGLKEHVYLQPDSPAEDLRDELGAGPEGVLVVVRAPATMSAYHQFENELFDVVLKRIGEQPNVVAIILPRTAEQAAEIAAKMPPNAKIPERVLETVSLIKSADLVISAGGTMNREAAVLGTPAYTIFAGEQGAVDRDLIERGLLRTAEKAEDIEFRRKEPGQGWAVENREIILHELLEIAKRPRHAAVPGLHPESKR
jgi:predicted glycosyltransferase